MTTAGSGALVSVVVPSYNHESYVEECLETVARQTYPNLELLVVDDASSDASASVVERFVNSAAVQRRFEGRVAFEVLARNSGAHHALNVGIRRARGAYVSLLNSDDRYPHDRIATLCEALEERHAACAFGLVRIIDARGREVTEEDWLGSAFNHAQQGIAAHPSVGFALLASNVTISTGNLLFRRDLFDQIGGFRPLRYCHDWDFILRSVLAAEPVYVRRVAYEYRLHDTNSFRSLRHVGHEETETVLRTYFSCILREQYGNALAPGPNTWPGIFERWLEAMHLMGYWQRARRSPE